jgi:hypothetical protein
VQCDQEFGDFVGFDVIVDYPALHAAHPPNILVLVDVPLDDRVVHGMPSRL